jgi:cytochrome P450
MRQEAKDAIQLDEGFRFNPFDYRFHAEPKLVYRFLRDQSPAHYNEALNLYVISRYADVAGALKNDGMYSFCHSDTYERFHPEKFADLVGFFCQDSPAHNGRRQLAGRPFTPQRSSALTPMVRRFGEHFLNLAMDRMRCSPSGIDFMADIAGPLSMAIIADLIGLPEQERDRIRCWIDLTVSRDNGSAVVQREALEASEQLLKYLYAFWNSRCSAGAGGECLADRIIQVVASGKLSRQHGISFLWALCFAGQEATAKLLGNAIYQARCNDLVGILHCSPNLIAEFLAEVMRLDSPAQIVYRTVVEEGELHGVHLRKGARAALLLGSANVDERVFGADAAKLRVGRVPAADPLTFGWGAHYCLGRHLGELEAGVCLQQFFQRVYDYQIDFDRCTRVHTSTVHGFSRLPLQAIELAE